MNNVQLIGNLTRDPELKTGVGEKNTSICRFSLAVSDGYGENERTSFINIVAFGKTAENCGKYLAKGRKAGVNGRIQTGSYDKDGKKVYTTDIIAERVEFLSPRNGQSSGSDQADQAQEAPAEMETTSIDDDDIPF